jgi:hypothetical protein
MSFGPHFNTAPLYFKDKFAYVTDNYSGSQKSEFRRQHENGGDEI